MSMHAGESDRIEFDTFSDPLAGPVEFLPLDQAFVFSSGLRTREGGTEELVARWDMPPGYYLYRRLFGAEAGAGLSLGQLAVPDGETRTDEYFGESEVYFGNVEIVVPVLGRTAQTVTVRFGYQGCAERGVCYPPAEREATFRFAEAPAPARWQWAVPASVAALLLTAYWIARAMRSRRNVR